MNKNIDRFSSDINDFKGEGIDIFIKENKMAKPYLEVGTIVELTTISGEIEIEYLRPVYNGKIYDYRGIINVNGEEKYICFNRDIVINHNELLKKNDIENGPKTL